MSEIREAGRALLHRLNFAKDNGEAFEDMLPEMRALARALGLPLHRGGDRCTFSTEAECGKAHAMQQQPFDVSGTVKCSGPESGNQVFFETDEELSMALVGRRGFIMSTSETGAVK